MVETETASLDRSKERQMVWSRTHNGFNIYRWEDMVAGEVLKFTENADVCRKSVQDNTGGAAWMTERKIVSERFGKHLLPLSLYQANCDIAWMFSWYSAGYGWLVMACCENGRRSGSWSGNSDDVWFCETCGVDLLETWCLIVLNCVEF